MTPFRKIHVHFWRDMEEYTPEQKYFYLYLMSNPGTNSVGCYKITKRTIAFETGYNEETIDKLLELFIKRHKIEYDTETKEIWLANWYKYNKPVNEATRKVHLQDAETIHNETFKARVDEILTVRDKKENENKNKKEKKKEYAPDVYLSEDEYKKLCTTYGRQQVEVILKKLSNAKGAKGYKYKSDYRAILNWVVEAVKAKPLQNPRDGPIVQTDSDTQKVLAELKAGRGG